MGDQVDLGKAGDSDIPMLGLDRDVVLEQGAWFRAPVEAAAQPLFFLTEVAIDRAGADDVEVALHLGGDGNVLLRPGQPERQEGLEPDRPRVAGGLPNVPQDGEEPGGVGGRAAAAPRRGGTGRPGQDTDRGLAVVAGGGTDLRILYSPPCPGNTVDGAMMPGWVTITNGLTGGYPLRTNPRFRMCFLCAAPAG